jgi:hypothetical protein
MVSFYLDVPTASGAWAAPGTAMYQQQLANQQLYGQSKYNVKI